VVSVVVVAVLVLSLVAVAELVPLSAVPGPALALVSAVADDEPLLEVPDEPPVLLVSVGEKHATPRLPASASHLVVRDLGRPAGPSARSPTPSGPPRPSSVVRMLPNE
jgi:hypothetical protein